MNVSSIGQSRSVSYSSAASDTSQLEQQKTKLQAEINKVNQGKDSQEVKQKAVQVLQQQIKQIEQQIAQATNSAKSEGSESSGVSHTSASANVNASSSINKSEAKTSNSATASSSSANRAALSELKLPNETGQLLDVMI
ncbi:MAG: FlxA-like family protein [Gorillibacterium sp.]|nr:FlxA-like family protein [Gorillibacterium sp.]